MEFTVIFCIYLYKKFDILFISNTKHKTPITKHAILPLKLLNIKLQLANCLVQDASVSAGDIQRRRTV